MYIDISTIAVIHWGYGRHEVDLPDGVRNAPEGILVSAVASDESKLVLIYTSFSGWPKF
jgi:hypothetical protein